MAEYYNVTTNLGDAEIANAIATNTKLNITHIAFGDGNGSVPTPTKTRTGLVKEVHRQAVTKYTMHPTIANYIVIETIIPSNIGGFWIREMGIIADNVLISHGSHAPFFKVADPDGVSEYRLKFTQNIRDGNVVEISLDESLIYASQAWVNENYIRRNELVDDLTTDNAKKPVSAKQAKLLNDNKLNADQYATTEKKGIIQLASEAEVLSGSDNTKAVTPETLKKSFQGSLSRTGWRKLVDGSIEQWGVTPLIAGHQSLEVTLPVTFAKAGFNVIVSAAFITKASTSGLQSFYAEFINNSKIIIFHDNVDATYAQSCYWRVIGE